jgi:hypothetical protein
VCWPRTGCCTGRCTPRSMPDGRLPRSC